MCCGGYSDIFKTTKLKWLQEQAEGHIGPPECCDRYMCRLKATGASLMSTGVG